MKSQKLLCSQNPLPMQPAGVMLIFCLLLLSCDQQELPESRLYGNPKLGVISEAYVKLYTKPESNAPIVTLLRAGDIVAIDFVSTRYDIQFGLHAPWYRVHYKDFNGWVFGSFIHPSQEAHEAAHFSAYVQKKFFPFSAKSQN